MAAALDTLVDGDGMDSYPIPDSNDVMENGGNLFAPDNDMDMELPNINTKVRNIFCHVRSMQQTLLHCTKVKNIFYHGSMQQGLLH